MRRRRPPRRQLTTIQAQPGRDPKPCPSPMSCSRTTSATPRPSPGRCRCRRPATSPSSPAWTPASTSTRILGLAEGEAHVIRNAGGVVTDDEIRSLAISQRLLGTREIILIHHTDCGMLTFTDDDFKAAIQADTGIKPPWSAEAFGDLDADVPPVDRADQGQPVRAAHRRRARVRVRRRHRQAERGQLTCGGRRPPHPPGPAGARSGVRGCRRGPAARPGTARTARRVPRRSACCSRPRPRAGPARSAANASYCCSSGLDDLGDLLGPLDLPGYLQVGAVRRLAQRVGGQRQPGRALDRLEQGHRRGRVRGLGQVVRHVHGEPDRRALVLAHPVARAARPRCRAPAAGRPAAGSRRSGSRGSRARSRPSGRVCGTPIGMPWKPDRQPHPQRRGDVEHGAGERLPVAVRLRAR